MVRKTIEEIYYDASSGGSLGGIEKLYRAAKEHNYSRDEVKNWLMTQDVYTLQKPIRWKFSRNRTLVSHIDDVWQIDLVDMQAYKRQNDNHGFLLTCIDIFSKFAWAIPIKQKSSAHMTEALQKILQSGRKPIKIQSDRGLEFLNNSFQSELKKEKIGFYTTFNETKAAVVERFNRTLKSRMWRYFTRVGSHRYVDKIQK